MRLDPYAMQQGSEFEDELCLLLDSGFNTDSEKWGRRDCVTVHGLRTDYQQ